MNSPVPSTLAFSLEPLTVPLDQLLPSRKMPDGVLTSRKFTQIVASIRAVGLVEPLSVAPADKGTRQHLILDGHIRLLALRHLEIAEAPCLVSTDDESYTYNNRINRISTIQEHFMIRRAIERGASPERLGEALDVDPSTILKKVNLLDGVCPEAIDLLKDQHFSPHMGAVLRKRKPTRQIECTELMLAANNFSVAYAEALVAASPPEMLASGTRPKRMSGLSAEQMARMEREMGNLKGQLRLAEQSYGQDVLNLVLAKGYLAKLLENRAIARFLARHQPDVLSEFESLVQTVALDGK